ncbi:hypothetical protein EV421DRAFT_1814889 [Armillaria borealis]|uniref:Hydrophobin n=1 Tax=Armillaria borealis TaxID=47425 RepID=A0AA39JHU0_9AGAR|nr:hypothetical protein EV421DRAFT_1814889 [Armillaria borealis]
MLNLRRSLLPLVFALIQCSSVNAYYVTCTGFNCDSSDGPNVGLAIGLAVGLCMYYSHLGRTVFRILTFGRF